ncbi:MFS transporter [Allopontixanthobacter sp.]|uniref:MFS transporter n=1 Tax=Allopontixanthobacter sp. TaxID=2906452 RepID=UPI002ABC5CDA|nr:MFS transporter [Allopontixanthobacter sp.]MDZ4307510.1 MFS transporter [Allopontixanthobacter sp.]
MLYALAAAGGSASYAPFLTLLLPVRAEMIWQDDALQVLAYAAFVGACAASAANILFGWVSDRSGRRREWIIAGALLSSVLLVGMQYVASIAGLLVMIVLWQTAVNMMLSPLGAWAGDCVPDSQKGTLGGLLSAAPAIGAMVGAIVTIPGLADADMRLFLVAALVLGLVLPVVFFGRPRPMPELMTPKRELRIAVVTGSETGGGKARGSAVGRMWFARLLTQIAEAALFAFLLLWLRSIDDGFTDSDAARLFTTVLIVSVPIAIYVGRWSDRTGRPILPLTILSGGGAAGLVWMALAEDAAMAVSGFAIFGVLTGVFLSLHSSQTLRVLPRPQTRGRDLGLFNLTNTVPSLIMPWLALALVPVFGFQALFLLLAGLAAISSLLLATMREN